MIFEPLQNKKEKMEKEIMKSKDKKIDDKSDFYLGFKKGIDDSFIIFSSYVDFFKRYQNNIKLLMEEHKDVWSEFIKYYEAQSDIDKTNYISRYNNWLFDYIFHDLKTSDPDDFLRL